MLHKSGLVGTLPIVRCPVAEPEGAEPMRDTWNDIALPILRTLQELEDEEEGNAWGTEIEVLTERLGIDDNQVGQQLESLEDAGYISIKDNAQTFDNPNQHHGIKLRSEGRRELGEWPADPMAALASALARRLDEASTAAANNEERFRLKALAEKVRDAGPTIGLTLAVEAVKAALGGT